MIGWINHHIVDVRSYLSIREIFIFRNMIENLIEIFIKNFQKYNITGICVIVSWLFSQYVPDFKNIKGFLISGIKFYYFHKWIEYENEKYDIGYMNNIRTIPMLHLLAIPLCYRRTCSFRK